MSYITDISSYVKIYVQITKYLRKYTTCRFRIAKVGVSIILLKVHPVHDKFTQYMISSPST